MQSLFGIKYYKLLKSSLRAYLLKMLLNLQMVMHEPWKSSAPEVYLLRNTDGSVPRGWDPNADSSLPIYHAAFLLVNDVTLLRP